MLCEREEREEAFCTALTRLLGAPEERRAGELDRRRRALIGDIDVIGKRPMGTLQLDRSGMIPAGRSMVHAGFVDGLAVQVEADPIGVVE